MDFFKDFSDISSTPIYPKHNQQSTQKNKSVKFASSTNARKDDFDDLLSDLISKEDLKKSRRNIEPHSSQNLGLNSNDPFSKTTQKFNHISSQTEFNLNFGLSKQGNKGSKKSILDDLMSEDNRSIRSGVTGRRDNTQTDNFNFTKNIEPALMNQVSQPNVGGRAGMRPPLKKKGESREPSIFNDDNKSVSRMNDNMGSIEDLEILSVTPKMPKRQTYQPDRIQESEQAIKLEISASKQKPPQQPFRPFQPEKLPSIIGIPFANSPMVQEKVVQKIIHIKQDNKQLTQRHQQQIKLIKQSYQRQIINLKENYQKIVKDEQQNRKLLVRTYEESMQMEKRKWEKMIKDDGERVRQVYEWEQKKKTEGYELEVKKLKELIETITKSQSQTTAQNQHRETSLSFQQQQSSYLQVQTKLKDLNQQKQRLQHQKLMIETKRRQLESEEHDFDLYKRKEENKLNDERRKMFEYESQLRKREVEMKKLILSEKQSLAAQLVNSEMTLAQARENVRHENEKLTMEKDLFGQQKMEYEKINNKILSDLKQRQRILEGEKQQVHQLQVQLYKKISTIELMSVQRGLSSTKVNQSLNQTSKRRPETAQRSVSFYHDQPHKENNRNRINSELDKKVAQTKGRYQQMEQMARSNSVHRQGMVNGREDGCKIHLQKYIQKLTKDKLKLVQY